MREHGTLLLLGGMLLVLRSAGCPDGEKQRNTKRIMRLEGAPDSCIYETACNVKGRKRVCLYHTTRQDTNPRREGEFKVAPVSTIDCMREMMGWQERGALIACFFFLGFHV